MTDQFIVLRVSSLSAGALTAIGPFPTQDAAYDYGMAEDMPDQTWLVARIDAVGKGSTVSFTLQDPEAQRMLDAGWEVEKTSLFDEEQVEGWSWINPETGQWLCAIGSHNEPPVAPEGWSGK